MGLVQLKNPKESEYFKLAIEEYIHQFLPTEDECDGYVKYLCRRHKDDIGKYHLMLSELDWKLLIEKRKRDIKDLEDKKTVLKEDFLHFIQIFHSSYALIREIAEEEIEKVAHKFKRPN